MAEPAAWPYAALIKTITNYGSHQPSTFCLKRIILVAAAILGLSSAVCFADSLLMARRYAPAEKPTGSDAARSVGLSAPVGCESIENHQERSGERFSEAEIHVITPIVNQVGHMRPCIRREEASNVARPTPVLTNSVGSSVPFLQGSGLSMNAAIQEGKLALAQEWRRAAEKEEKKRAFL